MRAKADLIKSDTSLDMSMHDFTQLDTMQELHEDSNIIHHIDGAVISDCGHLLVIGWLYDQSLRSVVPSILMQTLRNNSEFKKVPLQDAYPDSSFIRLERPDVSNAVGFIDSHDHGFAIYIPNYNQAETLLFDLDGQSYKITLDIRKGSREVRRFLKKCATKELYQSLTNALGEVNYFTSLLEDLTFYNNNQYQQFSHCDKAILLDNQWLIINGWVGSNKHEIESLRVYIDDLESSVRENIKHYIRPDLNSVFLKSSHEAMGYISVIDVSENKQAIEEIEILLSLKNGLRESYTKNIDSFDWHDINEYLIQNPQLYPILVQLINSLSDKAESRKNKGKIKDYQSKTFTSFIQGFPNNFDDPNRAILSIDKAYPLDDAGILLYGWMITPDTAPNEITVHNEYGECVSIKNKILPQRREDVAEIFKAKYSNVSSRCGFIVHVELPTLAGDVRALCLHYAERGDVWIKIPVERYLKPDVKLIKEMLSMIPHPNQINHYLYDMFENGLGLAIEKINQKRLANAESLLKNINVRQFGVPVENPTTSIIVPLYGRCDFMRYQLARFSGDEDLIKSDIIYVVDDPAIIDETLALASRYQWIFDISFRVVTYEHNLGFAGANNVGSKFAQAKRLLLLNSDAIPKSQGWLRTLEVALDELPEAGAVGPLLQFGDGSIQHAGMHPRLEPQLPGFLINTHPGMGQYWDDQARGTTPYEQPMLTAACIMLKTSHFQKLNGFDEGYIIGDFEDSDLCLSLRTKGLRLYVVPQAKLWHLERQSQTLGNVAGVRQLITLFNGWRYLKKIENGILIDPMNIKLTKVGEQ